MNSIPKFVTSVIAFMVALLVCVGLVFTGVIVTTAKTYHNNVISEIEDSNFHEDVINQCIQKAEEKGYALTVSKELNVSSTVYYKVTLYYDLSLPLFGKVHTGKLVGYAYPGASIEGTVGTADHYFEIDSYGVLGIKAAYRWATQTEEYCSDLNDPNVAGTKNDQLPSEITIPTYWNGVKVKALRDYMFVNCTGLTKISFEDGVQTIGSNAFQNCVNLSGAVAAPDSITNIETQAFENCPQLSAVNFNTTSNLKTIGDYAFKNCTSFVDVVLPDSMTSNGFGAYQGCINMASFKAPFVGANPTGSKKTGGYIGHIFGSEDYSTHNETVPTTLTAISITKYVTAYSCYELDSLTSLTISEDVKEIKDWAFPGCDGLTSVTIPKNVTKTGTGVFYECANLTEVVIEDNSTLTTMGGTNFCYCKNLEKINIPSTVISIGNYCFQDCDKLTFSSAATGKLPEGVQKLGFGAFKDCDGFETFVFPASATTIEPQILTNCANNKYIQVAEGSTSFCVGENHELLTLDKKEIVQYPCAGIENYTIPSTVVKIRDNAFDQSDTLEEVYFDNATQLTTIGHTAFGHCDIQNSIKLPASVTTIDQYAFYYGGNWDEIWIGPNVTKIGTYAFWGCTGIRNRTYLLMETVPTIGSQAFGAGNGGTEYYLFVKNQAMYDALVAGKHYNASICVVTINGTLAYDVSVDKPV